MIKQGESGFLIGQLKELPDVFTQGKTISELRDNITDVLAMYLGHTEIDSVLCAMICRQVGVPTPSGK
jgi:predicted RNase H-like HicB family nuclease